MMRDEWLPMNILIFNVKTWQRVKIVGGEGQSSRSGIQSDYSASNLFVPGAAFPGGRIEDADILSGWAENIRSDRNDDAPEAGH